MEQKEKVKKLELFYYSIAGAFSGVVGRVNAQPFDVLKIRFQIQNKKDGKLKYVGVLTSLKTIVKNEGLHSLWKGHVPAQVLSIVYNGVQFTTYELVKKKINTIIGDDDKFYTKSAVEFLCGGLAGVSAAAVCQPLDVLRTRLVVQSEVKVYKNMLQAFRSMFRENGFRTFYKGMIPTLSMIFPDAGLRFAFYGSLQRLWILFVPETEENDKKLMRLVCGMLSGMSSKLILLPLDIVKKRLQVQGFHGFDDHYNGMFDCFKTLIKREGVSALYRGSIPTVLKAAIMSGGIFFTYDQTCDFLNWYLEEKI